MSLGTLDDEVWVAGGSQPDDKIRKWVVEQLQKFVRDGA